MPRRSFASQRSLSDSLPPFRRAQRTGHPTFLATFKEFPPSQKPGSFNVEDALQSLERGTQGGGA